MEQYDADTIGQTKSKVTDRRRTTQHETNMIRDKQAGIVI